jgi:hypothetical protein
MVRGGASPPLDSAGERYLASAAFGVTRGASQIVPKSVAVSLVGARRSEPDH